MAVCACHEFEKTNFRIVKHLELEIRCLEEWVHLQMQKVMPETIYYIILRLNYE